MLVVVDTSILARVVNLDDPAHGTAAEALKKLRAQGETLVIAPQNIMEFWAVATRPAEARGGLGLSHESVKSAIARFTSSFRLLPERPDVFTEWLRLADRCVVSGRQVHDARLAAWMRVNDVQRVLTFNDRDFSRYPDIMAVHPREFNSDTA
jgi:predicted nucleic acid-binding protein